MGKKKVLEEILFDVREGSFLGIVNQLREYQLAYYINHFMKIELRRETDFEMYSKEGETPQYYPLLVYIDEETFLTYVLLSTRNANQMLHKELKSFDNLFFIFGRDHAEKAEEFKKNQRNIPKTLLVKQFDFSTFPKEEKEEAALKKTMNKETKALFSIYDYFRKTLLPEMEYNFIEIGKAEDVD